MKPQVMVQSSVTKNSLAKVTFASVLLMQLLSATPALAQAHVQPQQAVENKAAPNSTIMIPKFRILRVYDNAVALFMMARVNQLTFDSWDKFHNPNESTYKNIFEGSSSINFDKAVRTQKMHVAAAYMRTYYPDLKEITIGMVASAFSASADPLEFAEKLDALNVKTLMTCDSFNDEKIQDRIKTAMQFMISQRPLRQEKMQAEYVQYLEQASADCNIE